METVRESAVTTAINLSTFQKVKNLFESNDNVHGFERQEISFRLRKTGEDNVNLEMLLSDSSKGIMWYKPICFYDREIDIYLINEFAITYKEVSKKHDFIRKPEYLESVLNALIAAFSMEVFVMVEDAWIEKNNTAIINGLEVDLDYSTKGIEVTVTERVEMGKQPNGDPLYYSTYKDRVGVYVLNGVNIVSINPFWDTKEAYDFLIDHKLLSALNRA